MEHLTPTETETLKMFDEKFPHKIAEVIDDFDSTTKPDIKDFLLTQLRLARAEAYEDGKNAAVDYARDYLIEHFDEGLSQALIHKILEDARKV